jgi:hypothetical protein
MLARLRQAPWFVALLLVGASATGCDLLAEATAFTVDTDWQSFTVDSDALGVTVPDSTIPAIPCDSSNDVCGQAGSQLSCSSQQYSCDIRCGEDGTCELVATAETSVVVDLSEEIGDKTSAGALSKVSLNWVEYRVEVNSLTFDTPTIEIYVGPETAAGTQDGGVVKFATMPTIPKGMTPNGDVEDITPAGREALATFVKNYKQPFRFFAKANLSFAGGEPLPQGRLTIDMKAGLLVEPL